MRLFNTLPTHLFQPAQYLQLPGRRVGHAAAVTLIAAVWNTQAIASDLTVVVQTVSQSTGALMLALYNNEKDFGANPSQASRKAAIKGEMEFTFTDLDSGSYAVTLFHDINDNGELDTNLLGMPTEPWGASLQGNTIFGAPTWSDTRFDIADENLSLVITLK